MGIIQNIRDRIEERRNMTPEERDARRSKRGGRIANFIGIIIGQIFGTKYIGYAVAAGILSMVVKYVIF